MDPAVERKMKKCSSEVRVKMKKKNENDSYILWISPAVWDLISTCPAKKFFFQIFSRKLQVGF